MNPPTRPLDVDDDGMMHHPVYDSSGDNRVAEVITEVLEVNVGCQQSGTFAVTTVYNFEEQ